MISAAGASGTSMRERFIVALLLWPNAAIAQHKWFAAHKAKHFGAGVDGRRHGIRRADRMDHR